ncbi:YoaK family protein [Hymenobacter baengnokdamensis]|uniref:YoaK family protein n=1 Tax=Hymenobacter baengnokdamensis TaxID=2615203 RepID=UPI001243B4B1|nr:YoaK family protein [Hymenobacter baengnokdamensis]
MADSTSPPAAGPLAGLSFTLTLVALAGYVDAVSYLRFQGLFVSFMSGNTTSLGVAIAQQNAAKAGELAGVVGLFIGGVLLGTLLHYRAGRWGNTCILLLTAALLLLAHTVPAATIAGLTLGMGTLNASVHQVGRIKVSLTFVTGTLVRMGTGLAEWLSGRAPAQDWLWPGTLWLAFLTGALSGAATLRHQPTRVLLLAAGLSLALALVARRARGIA